MGDYLENISDLGESEESINEDAMYDSEGNYVYQNVPDFFRTAVDLVGLLHINAALEMPVIKIHTALRKLKGDAIVQKNLMEAAKTQ